jgi:hypothetical protein
LADLFFGVQMIDSGLFVVFLRAYGRVLGLDMRFLGQKRRKKIQKQQTKADPLFDFAQGRLSEDDNRKGDGKSSCNSKDETRGSLRCAVHDAAVNGSGRDDAAF